MPLRRPENQSIIYLTTEKSQKKPDIVGGVAYDGSSEQQVEITATIQ